MGKHYRESQARKEALHRRKRNLTAGAVGLVIAAGSFVGYKALSGEDQTSSPMPKAAAELVSKAADIGNNPDLKNASKVSYREAVQTKIGINNLTIAEVGNQQPGNYERLITIFSRLDTYLQNNPANSVHQVTEFDEHDAITNNLLLEGAITPVGKDMVVLVAPATLNLGSFEGIPDVFTESRTDRTLSIVRSDMSGSFEGMATEACQAMVEVKLVHPEQVKPYALNKVTLLMQEQFCNSFAKAITPSLLGVDYASYSAVSAEGARQMFTDQVVAPGNYGYVSMMPYANQETYNSLATEIPSNFGKSLVFPAATRS